ncbi:MAG: hypothetical protein HY534_06880 [Chloroflexi bacterium]|nr:hypothetical protein [Chloroflexota bacterium]
MNLKRTIVAGLIASMVMGMLAMGYEAVAGAGFWSPVVFIAATVLRDLQTVAAPVPFLGLPVVLGLMGHMMNSVILAIAFAAILGTRVRGTGQRIVAGGIYGITVFAVMWAVVLPLVDPAMLRLNPAAFAVAHLMWGGVLGLGVSWGQETANTETGLSPAH